MWLRLTHTSKGSILLNSGQVLYFREITDGRGGHDCEVYFSFQDCIVIDEARAEVEKQMRSVGILKDPPKEG